jgi:hypothetical protein
MGWVIGGYKSQPLINHTGGTGGFASEIALLPEADTGVVILTNGAQSSGFMFAVQYRLFELLFGQAPEVDPLIGQLVEATAAQRAQLRAGLGTVDSAAVAPYVGRYANAALGEVELQLRDGRLVLDAGEIRSELRPTVGAAGETVVYLFVDPPLAGDLVSVVPRQAAEGRPELAMSAHGELSAQGELAETSVFALMGPLAAATPAP